MLDIEKALQVEPTRETRMYHETVYILAGSLVQIVEMFHCIIASELFLNSWKKYTANAKFPLKCADLHTVIWEPTIKYCRERLLKYENLSLTFQELNDDFNCNVSPPHVMKELESLNKGMQNCGKFKSSKTSGWIKDIASCIEKYQRLVQSYKPNAESVLQSKSLGDMRGKYEDLVKMVKVSTWSRDDISSSSSF